MLLQIMEFLLAEAVGELNPAPARAVIAPGALVAWDDCCDGYAWARLVTVTAPTTPVQSQGPTLWIIQVALGVLRCAASLDDSGNTPTAAQVTADGVQGLADMEALARAFRCSGLQPLMMGSWTPTGPAGACFGGEWTATLRVPVECCP